MISIFDYEKKYIDMAKRWYIRENYNDQMENMSRAEREEFRKKISDGLLDKDVLYQYFAKKPDMQEKYNKEQEKYNKLKKAIAVGGLVLASGTAIYAGVKIIDGIRDKNPIETEAKEDETTVNLSQDEILTDFDKFFEECKELDNTENRDKKIVDFTKSKIVEAYNKENPDNQLTVDRLEYLHLNENVLVNKDKFGNEVSYERRSQKEIITPADNQEYNEISGGIYEFKIDGKTVAVYNSEGQEVIDTNIDSKNEFFAKTLSVIKEASVLQDLYKYNNDEHSINRVQNKYKNVVEAFVKSIENTKVKDEQKEI